MKKRGIKTVTTLLTAGMLAFTAASGISSNMLTSTETTVHQMEENEGPKVLVDGGGMTGKILPDKKWFSDVEAGIYKGNGYTRVNVKKENSSEKVTVLLEAHKNYIKKGADSQYHSNHVWVYTESSDRNVKCIGTLIADDFICVDNGIIYTIGDGVIEEYVVSPDKEKLVVVEQFLIKEKMCFTAHELISGREAEALYQKLQYELKNSPVSFRIK